MQCVETDTMHCDHCETLRQIGRLDRTTDTANDAYNVTYTLTAAGRQLYLADIHERRAEERTLCVPVDEKDGESPRGIAQQEAALILHPRQWLGSRRPRTP